ncbi:MAG: hypothetical protein ACOZCL_14965 [Bacillota bacterium]
MDKQYFKMAFEDGSSNSFTGEEIAIFKRYIEENNAYPENSFEFLEENLNYYSSRHTSSSYFSPAEYFHANSNFASTDELEKNMALYERSIEWFSSNVHPEDSEYVIKKEKYMYMDDLPQPITDLISYLNRYDIKDFHTLDLLVYCSGNIYQYLPRKNFMFKWKKDVPHIFTNLVDNNFYSMKSSDHRAELDDKHIVLFPIFIPIRKMLFLGEYGYRMGMIEYGRALEKIRAFLEGVSHSYTEISSFNNADVNELLGLDGIERSIFNIITYKSNK